MKKRRSIKAALSLFLIGAMLCALSLSAFAADIDLDQTGSITVSLEGEKDGTLLLYKVASIGIDGNDMIYSFTDEFAGCGLSLDDLEDTELAASLREWVETNNTPIFGTATIASGTAKFPDLKVGLYLIVQGSSSTGFVDINPFIVTIPYKGDYDVKTIEKVEAGTSTEPSPSPTTPGSTTTPSPTPTTPGGTVTPTPSEPSPESSESPKPSDGQGGETETGESPNPDDESGDNEGTESEDESETSPSSGTSGAPVPSNGTSGSSGSSGGGGSQETLPQTGQLNWPISVLAGVGLVLIIVGGAILIVGRKQKKTE